MFGTIAKAAAPAAGDSEEPEPPKDANPGAVNDKNDILRSLDRFLQQRT